MSNHLSLHPAVLDRISDLSSRLEEMEFEIDDLADLTPSKFFNGTIDSMSGHVSDMSHSLRLCLPNATLHTPGKSYMAPAVLENIQKELEHMSLFLRFIADSASETAKISFIAVSQNLEERSNTAKYLMQTVLDPEDNAA